MSNLHQVKMDAFDFLDGSNRSEQTLFDEDPVAHYFKTRQKIREERLGSSCASSMSLLSLNKTSFLGETVPAGREKLIERLSLDEELFKKPKTPPVKLKKMETLDFLAPTFSPQTPRVFHDELSSLTPDATASIYIRNGSLVDFPLRNESDILSRLEKDEKKFIPNTSGFSHNSDITHFSDVKQSGDDLSIGEFFAKRCEKSGNFGPEKEIIENLKKEEGSIRVIHDLLSKEDLSGTVICDRLLNKNLSESRHSTPIRQNLTNATPLRRGREWVPRGPITASTPETGQWKQLRQTLIEDDENEITLVSKTRDVLDVVKKIQNVPAGKIDCSAIASLVQDEFPEMDFQKTAVVNESLSSDRFRVPIDVLNAKIFVSVKKLIPVAIGSRDDWLMVRLINVTMNFGKQAIPAEQKNDIFWFGDWLSIRAKDVLLPPNTEHILHISILSKKQMNAMMKITLQATDVNKENILTNSFNLNLAVISPVFEITPALDFETIPNDLSAERRLTIVSSGENDTKLKIIITQNSPFILTRNIFVDGVILENVILSENSLEISLKKGQRVLEFDVRFSPNVPEIEVKRIVRYEGEICVKMEEEIVGKTRLVGSAAFAKFLCRSDCSPVVFNATIPGSTITKQFFVKNVGAMALKLVLLVASDPLSPEEDNQFFTVPKTVLIPINETVAFDIVFHPRLGNSHIRQYLVMYLDPNDKISYDVELIGTLSESTIRSSRASVKSAVSGVSGEGLAVKLSSTDGALSWMATPLQKSVLKTFQVKLKSEAGATARISLNPGAFKIMNEKGEAMSKVRKSLKPGVPVSITLQFKPDSIGFHLNQLAFEFNSKSDPSTVQLTGFGGCPKLRVEDTLLDLHGNRMVKLSHPRGDGFIYTAQFRITNYGNVAGFVLISAVSNVLSVAHSLKVYPLQSVLEPNTNVIVNLSQHLTRHEFRDVLVKQDIRKMATLNVVMGDEPSRQRLRKYLETKSVSTEENRKLVQQFPNERVVDLDGIKESKDFESIFLNSLSTCDVVAVIEKSGTNVDQTVIDLDESSCSFATLSETVIVRQIASKTLSEHSTDTRRRKSPNSSYLSANSHDTSRKIHDWLRKVE